LIDPEGITSLVAAVGAVASSSVGAYFDYIRKRRKREEPALVEEAATEAVAEAIAESPIFAEQATASARTAVASQEEVIAKAVSVAVRKELAVAQKKSDRSAFKSGLFFFVAGVLATIAITLYVHPGSLHSSPKCQMPGLWCPSGCGQYSWIAGVQRASAAS